MKGKGSKGKKSQGTAASNNPEEKSSNQKNMEELQLDTASSETQSPDLHGKEEEKDDDDDVTNDKGELVANKSPLIEEINIDNAFLSEQEMLQSIIDDNVGKFKLLLEKLQHKVIDINEAYGGIVFVHGALEILQFLVNKLGQDVVKQTAITAVKNDSLLLRAFQNLELKKIVGMIEIINIKATDIADFTKEMNLTDKLYEVINSFSENDSTLRLVELLVELGAELCPANQPRTPLHVAIRDGKEQFAIRILKSDKKKITFSSVTIKDGNTPLHYAAFYNRIGVAGKLLGEVDIATKNKQGKTALHLAIEGGVVKIVKNLLSHYEIALPSFKPFEKFLGIFQPSFYDIQDNEGSTPLHCVVKLKSSQVRSKIAQILLKNQFGRKRDVKLTLRNKLGFNPLEQAAIERKKELVDIFLEHNSSEETIGRIYEVLEKNCSKEDCQEMLEFMTTKVPTKYALSIPSVLDKTDDEEYLRAKNELQKVEIPSLSNREELNLLGEGASKVTTSFSANRARHAQFSQKPIPQQPGINYSESDLSKESSNSSTLKK